MLVFGWWVKGKRMKRVKGKRVCAPTCLARVLQAVDARVATRTLLNVHVSLHPHARADAGESAIPIIVIMEGKGRGKGKGKGLVGWLVGW